MTTPALTTVFTEPSTCQQLKSPPSALTAPSEAGYAPFFPASCFDGGCKPDGISSFSPGICPHSWTPGSPAVTNGKTTVTCCQVGIKEGDHLHCDAKVTSTVYFLSESDGFFSDVTIKTSTTGGSFYHDHWIAVTYASSDLALFTPASAPMALMSGQAFTGYTTLSYPPPTTMPTVVESTQSDSGLSGGAKAGIGVGVTFGALAVIAGIVFMLLKRRKRSPPEQPSSLETQQQTPSAHYGYQQPVRQTLL